MSFAAQENTLVDLEDGLFCKKKTVKSKLIFNWIIGTFLHWELLLQSNLLLKQEDREYYIF